MTREEILQKDPGRTPLALSVGALLRGQFRVGRILGAGGFGITYLAFDEVLEVPVAVKEYYPQHLAVDRTADETLQLRSTEDAENFRFGLNRFLEEARTLAKFQDHPNIVRVRTFFEANETGYLVMDYYEGRTLQGYVDQQQGRIPEPEALSVLHALLDGLEAVHREGILHRDVDPSNVYLADGGRVVLLDFGAARSAMGDRTQTLSVMLKQGYAPHEQYHSHGNQGPWTDIYACAATMYRVLTGYKPPAATARVMTEELVDPKDVAPGISDTLNDALVAGLAVKPEDRPQTVAAFRELLPDRPDTSAAQWTEAPYDEPTETLDTGESAVHVTTDRPCRLYVDGTEAARLTPTADAPALLHLTEGTHRFRAIRTDPANGVNDTVTVTAHRAETASGGTAAERTGGPATQVSVADLVWQQTVTATADRPTDVHIQFAPDATPAPVFDGRLSSDFEPSEVEAAEPTVHTPLGRLSEGDVGPEPMAAREAAARSADEPSSRDPSSPGTSPVLPLAVTAFFAAIILVGVWGWMGANKPPQAEDDEAMVTGTDDLVVDVTQNDRDPDGHRLRLQSVEALPDSVGTAEVVDTSRLRFRPASVFAGRAQIRYTVADVDGDTSQAVLTALVPFSGQARVVTRTAADPQTVVSDDLDLDGNRDLIVASYSGNAVVVYPNRGGRNDDRFAGKGVVLDETLTGAVDVQTADLDGDQDPDVLATAMQDNSVVWFENVGTAEVKFGPRQFVTTTAGGPLAARAGDVNGDGRMDVIVAERSANRIVWYPNRGGGDLSRFGEAQEVATGLNGLESIAVDDLDGDGDPDVVSAAYEDGTVAWHENRDGTFVTHVVDSMATEVLTVHVDDLDGDGSLDLLAGLGGPDHVVWYAQQTAVRDSGAPRAPARPDSARFVPADSVASGSVAADSTVPDSSTAPAPAPAPVDSVRFGSAQLITDAIPDPEVVRTADVDGDGDADVVTASFDSGVVAWHENRGDGTFGPRLIVASNAHEALDVHAADLDGDGDIDLVSASQADDTIAWYENAIH